jgi:starch-binding outer membrane protein, SusD/RagB family
MIGTDADIWGDIPFSQADSFSVYKTPVLDPQQTVYDDVQNLLSEGIADLQTGVGVGPQGFDLVYGGDPAKWIELAHTLKARFFLHTAEVLGAPAYQSALAEANLGISTNANDYIANFSGSQALESNPWWQFVDADGSTGRSGDLVATPSFLSTLMTSLSDPRFTDYFKPSDVGTGKFSPVRENTTYPQPFVTFNENLLIKAEAQFQTGATGPALATLNQERALWSTATPWHSAFTLPAIGASSLNAIMTEKYIVLFQNVETWNDYKRTCIPNLTPINNTQGGVIPGRLLYPLQERQTNPNVPAPSQQPARNWNDPTACT